MIRYRVVLSVVIVAVGLLVAGAVSGSLLLVYLAIGVAALALLMLVIGAVIWRDEIFGGSAAHDQAESASAVPAQAGVSSSEQELPADLGVGGQLAGSRPAPQETTQSPAESILNGQPGAGSLEADDAAAASSSAASARLATAAGTEARRPSNGDGDLGLPRLGSEVGPKAAPGSSAADSDVPAKTAEDVPAKTAEPPSSAVRPDEPPSVDELLRRAGRESARDSPAPTSPAGASPASDPASPSPEPGRPAPATAVPASATARVTAAQSPTDNADPAATDSDKAGSKDAPSSSAPSASASKESSTAARPAPAAAVADSGSDSTSAAGAGLPAEPPAATGSGTQVSVVPGIGRYHLADCILIRFLGADDLQVVTRKAAEASGCVPCKACRPES